MHKYFWNELRLDFSISPAEPLLIKTGLLSLDPSLPDMQFVRSNGTVFIPGSSLKGVFRSYAERILRSAGGTRACDPFSEFSCGRKLKKIQDGAEMYVKSCHACRLFGHQRLRGRASLTDCFPSGEVKLETRQGVAISRINNAASGGQLFDMEVAVDGTFTGSLLLANFETWQLGLVAAGVEGLREQRIRVGFGKNRGLGGVRFQPKNCLVRFAGSAPRDQMPGAGALASADIARQYGLSPEDFLKDLPDPEEEDRGPLWSQRRYSPEAWDRIQEVALQKLQETLTEGSSS